MRSVLAGILPQRSIFDNRHHAFAASVRRAFLVRPHPVCDLCVDGVFLGLISLYLMQEIVRKAAGNSASWWFALGVLALSSFGIYLGRFMRWNSWDLFLNPGKLFADVTEQVQDPLTRLQAFAFSALFAGFFLAMYLTLVAITHLQQEIREG